MGIILAILLFSMIVIVHELGHFLLAKLNGIQVFEFSLGMGPILLKKQVGETLYCLKLLPLGGSCMMGEDGDVPSEKPEEPSLEEAFSEGEVSLEHEEKEEFQYPKGNFNEKSVWARMSVIAGGPIFNFLLALVFSIIMIMWIGYNDTEIGTVVEDSAAYEVGIEAGDTITSLNGRNVYLWSEITSNNMFHPGEEVVITYVRDGESYKVTATPKWDEELETYLLGISSVSYKSANILEAVEHGVYTLRYWILTVIDSLKMMIGGGVSADDVAGPVGIVTLVDDTYSQSIVYGWGTVILNLMNFAVLLSANLGVMNLLPLPALDGGRLVFLVIEAIRGKRIPPEKEGMFHMAGFAFLMILMIVILFNDVLRLF